MSHLVNLYFNLASSLCQKNRDRQKSSLFRTPTGTSKKDKRNTVILVNTEFINMSLPSKYISLPFQQLNFFKKIDVTFGFSCWSTKNMKCYEFSQFFLDNKFQRWKGASYLCMVGNVAHICFHWLATPMDPCTKDQVKPDSLPRCWGKRGKFSGPPPCASGHCHRTRYSPMPCLPGLFLSPK